MSSAAVKARNGASPGALPLQEAAERVGVAASTLRRWAREGVIAPYDGDWSPAAVSHARIVAGSEPSGLAEWAVEFQGLQDERTLARIAVHYGHALYRDGDYYGRDVNIASRVAARAAGGEVLVTRPVVERARGELEFDRIAQVRLKGFTESTEVFTARERNGSR
jgi:class 3 adenylate cyclase